MELLDLVARTRRQVGVGVCLEKGGKEGGFGDGKLCGRHIDWETLSGAHRRRNDITPFKVSWAHSREERNDLTK